MSGDAPAVPKDSCATCNSPDFIHAVADINDPDTFGLQSPDVFEQPLNLRISKRSRGLIKNQEPTVLGQSAGNLDQLLLANPEAGSRCGGGGVCFNDADKGLMMHFFYLPATEHNRPAEEVAEADNFRSRGG